MVAPAAGPPATLMWSSLMTATAGSGCPSSQRLPVAVVAEGAQPGDLQPHQQSAHLFIGDLNKEKMRSGWAGAASKDHNKGNCF